MPAWSGSSSSRRYWGSPPPGGRPDGPPDSTFSPRLRRTDRGRDRVADAGLVGPDSPLTPQSSAMKAKLWAVACAGVLACLGAVWLAAHQPPGRPPGPGPVLTLLVGISLLGCGLAQWRAGPENRLGQIMVLTGFAWFAAQLVEASAPWLNTIGLAVQSAWIIGLIWLLLSFPSGRLSGRLDRWLVAIGFVAGVGL